MFIALLKGVYERWGTIFKIFWVLGGMLWSRVISTSAWRKSQTTSSQAFWESKAFCSWEGVQRMTKVVGSTIFTSSRLMSWMLTLSFTTTTHTTPTTMLSASPSRIGCRYKWVTQIFNQSLISFPRFETSSPTLSSSTFGVCSSKTAKQFSQSLNIWYNCNLIINIFRTGEICCLLLPWHDFISNLVKLNLCRLFK